MYFQDHHSHLTTTISQDDFPRRFPQGSPMEQEFLFCGTSGHFRNCLKLQLLDAEATSLKPHLLAELIRVLIPERDMLLQCLSQNSIRNGQRRFSPTSSSTPRRASSVCVVAKHLACVQVMMSSTAELRHCQQTLHLRTPSSSRSSDE